MTRNLTATALSLALLVAALAAQGAAFDVASIRRNPSLESGGSMFVKGSSFLATNTTAQPDRSGLRRAGRPRAERARLGRRRALSDRRTREGSRDLRTGAADGAGPSARSLQAVGEEGNTRAAGVSPPDRAIGRRARAADAEDRP